MNVIELCKDDGNDLTNKYNKVSIIFFFVKMKD